MAVLIFVRASRSTVLSPTAFDCDDVASSPHLVTLTVMDADGNTSSCTSTVTVLDKLAPEMSCVTEMTVCLDADGMSVVSVDEVDIASTDNCSLTLSFSATVEMTETTFTCTALTCGAAPTSLTMWGVDPSGNSSSCSVTVTVLDKIDPTISPTTCVDVTQTVDASCMTVVADYTTMLSVTDNCTDAMSLTFTQELMSGTVLTGTGSHEMTITIADECGNTTVCNFMLHVIDDIDPVITCTSFTVTLDANCEYELTTVLSGVTGTDNCITLTLTDTSDPAVLPHTFTFHGEELIVTATATDASGNTSVCALSVTAVDVTPPMTVACPSSMTICNSNDDCGNSIEWVEPGFMDNCSPMSVTTQLSVTADYLTPPHILLLGAGMTHTGDFFGVGTTTLTFSFEDALGNTAVCEFNFMVEDCEAPTFAGACPTSQTQCNDAGVCEAMVTVPGVFSQDNCSVTQTWSIELATGVIIDGGNLQNVGSRTFPVGTNTVTYTATDPAGNTAVCDHVVIVEDCEAPVIDPAACAALSPMTVSMEPGVCDAVIPSLTALVMSITTDNCALSSVTQDPMSGTMASTVASMVMHGTIIPVTVTATDVAGVTATCVVEVQIEDNEAPSCTPTAMTVTMTSISVTGDCCAPVPDVTAIAGYDNCGVMTATQNPGIGMTECVMMHGMSFTVDVTLEDKGGNTSVCAVTVTVTG